MNFVVMSGYANEISGPHHSLDSGHFLQKPFTPTALVATVQSALSRRPPND